MTLSTISSSAFSSGHFAKEREDGLQAYNPCPTPPPSTEDMGGPCRTSWHTASFDVAGFGCSTELRPGHTFDNCSLAPQDQKWGIILLTMTSIVRLLHVYLRGVEKTFAGQCHFENKCYFE